jgi:hypothetical protein
MKKIIMAVAIMLSPFFGVCQENSLWTEADRNYLLENLIRSRDELVKETAALSEKQWKFKESSDRWSINEVVEHIGIWEMLLMYDVTRGLRAGVVPELPMAAQADSIPLGFIMEEAKHHSPDYTKPFTYTVPMGLNILSNNVALFLKLRNESINYIKTAKDDLRRYSRPHNKSSSLHQAYITVFGHTDRHLRQIRSIKKHPNFPKS